MSGRSTERSIVMQIIVATLAGVGIFTVLHMMGIGTIYKVCPPLMLTVQQAFNCVWSLYNTLL